MGFGLLFMLPLALITGTLLVLAIRFIFKEYNGINLILFSMEITAVAGILIYHPQYNLGGFEFVILLIGICFAIAGLTKK